MSQAASGDQRAISPVIGGILMVGLAIAAMTLVGLLVSSGTFVQSPAEADLVFEEDGNDIIIGVASAIDLNEEDVTIQLNPGGECEGVWDGSGSIDQGDTVRVSNSDCDGTIQPGTELQIVHSTGIGQQLLETYEVRGS